MLSPPPPPLPFFHRTYATVSAHGKLWAPSVVDVEGCPCIARVVMRRLEPGDDTWAEAASVYISDHPHDYLRGHAVIGDRFILLSLSDSTTFFCFDCATGGTLTPVKTTASASRYIPISGKAVHVVAEDGDGDGKDMVVYFLLLAALFAYRLSEDGEGRLFIAPPVKVERLCPYYEEGYGKLVHLAGRMMCAVWMNVGLPCGCAQRHALITTFLVRGGHGGDGDDGGSGVEVLQSTCRSVDMLRTKAVPEWKSYDALCFLQEYPDRAGSKVDDVDLSMIPVGSSPTPAMAGCSEEQVGEEITDEMPNCCREFLSGGAPILKECTSVVTNPDFYFICQSHDLSHVYQISVTRAGKLTCHGQLLQPHLSLDTITPGECGVDEPPSWHFVKPPPGIWQCVEGVLCGRCLFAEGFIYACTGIGFIALELLKEDDTCYCLGWPVLMEFPYTEFPDTKLVSFDLICKEMNPSSLVLCAVEGCVMPAPFTSLHRLSATTVEVKLQEMAEGRKVPVRIDHIDISDSTVDHEGWIWTSHAFSLLANGSVRCNGKKS